MFVNHFLLQSAGCSLHLSQKFAQLYPITRSAPILSTKSAPGLIMATGTIGKSLKGHPSLVVSTDLGLTWQQVSTIIYPCVLSEMAIFCLFS